MLISQTAMAYNPVGNVLKGTTGVVNSDVHYENEQGDKKQQNELAPQTLRQIETIKEQAKRNNELLAELYLSGEKRVGPNNALELLKQDLERIGYVCSITRSQNKPENKMLACVDPMKEVVLSLEVDKTNSQITIKSVARNAGIEEILTQHFEVHPEASADVVALYAFDLCEQAGFDVSDKARSTEGYLIINKVVPNSLASKVPLLPGSEIYSLDGKSTQTMSATEFRVAINMKRHQKKNFQLTFMGEDGKQKTVTLNLK